MSFRMTMGRASVVLSQPAAPKLSSTRPTRGAAVSSSVRSGIPSERKRDLRPHPLVIPSDEALAGEDSLVLRLMLSGPYIRMGFRNDKGLEMDSAVDAVSAYGAGDVEILSLRPSVLWGGGGGNEGMDLEKPRGDGKNWQGLGDCEQYILPHRAFQIYRPYVSRYCLRAL